MAGEDAPVEGGKNFLTHKLGPLPVGVWMLAAGGIWWYVKGRGGSGAPGAQTDPAGNVGTIDPKTGYVYGSSQDQSAQGAGFGGGGSGGSTSSGSTTAGQYADNNAWSRAAINFLVGVGVDPTEANSAVTQFVTSQGLTTQQQADVNLAIQSIGAPPVPPTPGNAPGPVVTPPGGGQVYATNPVTGLAVSSKSSNSVGLKWNKSTNANAYTVSWTGGGGGGGSQTVSGTAARTTIGGLAPDTRYDFTVQATPAKPGAGSATTSATTAGSPAAPEPAPAPTPAPTSSGPSYTPAEVAQLQASEAAGGLPSVGHYAGEIGNRWGASLSGPAGHTVWDGSKWITVND